MRIGLISDTHQPLEQRMPWDEVTDAFAGVDLILHAGDIVHPMILDWLEQIAPVLAARGNHDMGWSDPRMEEVQRLTVDGVRIAMTHIMEPETRPISLLRHIYLNDDEVDVIITGDTHIERIDYREDVLQINSGSATQPHLWSTRLGSVGLLEIDGARLDARIMRLGETEGRRNPAVEYSFTRETGVVRLG